MAERIYIGDIRKAGHCVAGARRWFNSHGLDFQKLLRDGYDADELLATGDQLAENVVRRTRERMNG